MNTIKATVVIATPAGSQLMSVQVDDGDPFAVLTMQATTVQLTRNECREVSDALRAAALRAPFDFAPHRLGN